jgi:Calcineurin-like phosphoesterase
MLTLAHLSDVHLAPLPRLAMKELRGKRLFGYQSWRFRRRHIHEQEIANLIAADVRAANPDHIALTGDLINLSAKLEYGIGAQWLAGLGRPDQLTFVPGNHDAYVPMSWDKGLGLWAAYMTGDLRMAGAQGTSALANPFPFVRQRRNIALVGVSTALPQPIGYATGRMGASQIEGGGNPGHASAARLLPNPSHPSSAAPRLDQAAQGAARCSRAPGGARNRGGGARAARPQPYGFARIDRLAPWSRARDGNSFGVGQRRLAPPAGGMVSLPDQAPGRGVALRGPGQTL